MFEKMAERSRFSLFEPYSTAPVLWTERTWSEPPSTIYVVSLYMAAVPPRLWFVQCASREAPAWARLASRASLPRDCVVCVWSPRRVASLDLGRSLVAIAHLVVSSHEPSPAAIKVDPPRGAHAHHILGRFGPNATGELSLLCAYLKRLSTL